MGCFDSVMATCPKCKTKVEFQTKVGPCDLQEYSETRVPPQIAYGLHGGTTTCVCGASLKILVSNPVTRVQMHVEEVIPDDDGFGY